MSKIKITLLLFIFAVSGFYYSSNAKSDSLDISKMKTYYMVFLKKGNNRTHDSVTAAKIQEEHMKNMSKMAEAGKLIVAGPFLDDGELRGIYIFDAASEEEVRKLTETDPAVIAGRLSYEIHPWMTQKGTCFK